MVTMSSRTSPDLPTALSSIYNKKLNIFVISQEDIIYGQNHKFLTGKSVNFQKLYLKINKNLQQETSPKISMKL